MKKIVIYFTVAIFVTSCRKENGINSQIISEPFNSAPKVLIGNDFDIILPADSCLLSGSAQDAENNIESYLWKKIAGPVPHKFQNKDSAVTKLNGLVRGMYDFELSVTDTKGLKGKDTVRVYVYDPPTGPNEKLFINIPSICDWLCLTVVINNFSSFISNSIFKVYIKSSEANTWIEVKHESQWLAGDKFSYGLYNDALVIGVPENILWDVKITF